jgi:hypothetical protein
MGPLLRGPIDDEEIAGPKKEAAIVAMCERDKWPASVLACAASATEPTVQNCVDELPPEMHARYATAMEKYGTSVEDDIPEEDEEDAVTTCAEAFAATSIDAWPPSVSTEAERPLATKLRGASLRKLCEDQNWELAAKQCLADTPASGIEACLEKLGDARRGEVTLAVHKADKLRAKIVKAQAKPANVTCEKAVAAHYGNAKWTGKAPELKGADRAKAIAASKKKMLASCKTWSIETRACIVADDGDACYALAGTSWGYPAQEKSKLRRIGIVECDVYADAIEKLASCDELSEESRQALYDSFEQLATAWATIPPDALEAAKTSCKAAADATLQAARTCT